MKKLNLFSSCCAAALLTIGTNVNAQSFQKTFVESGTDMNHYSIETAPNGDYILAGTLFRGGNQDIHVMRLDPVGNQIWSIEFDQTSDDRALDVVVDPYGDIVVVGYIELSSSDAALYVLKLDPSGNMISDLEVEGFHTAAGTNIIHSAATDTYIIGGYMGEPFQVPMVGCVARVLEVDLGLGLIANQELSTSYLKHASINDIVEVPTGYFITGSMANTVSSPVSGEGVLAVFLDHSLNVIWDLSFESTNSEHVGVSAVYDAPNDELFLMSNNSVIHNPQISQILDVSGGPFIASEYYLALDPTYGATNAAGFKLEISPYDPSNLIAAGLFRTAMDYEGNSNSATPWIIEFEKTSGSPVAGVVWPAPSPNFHAHGGGLFSTFSGEHPYFFNQEMMVIRPDGNGVAFISPKLVDEFAIDVVTTINLSEDMPCFKKIMFEPYTIGHIDNPISDFPQGVVDMMPGYPTSYFSVSETIYCDEIFDLYTPESNGGKETNAQSTINMGNISIKVSPNPASSSAFVEITGDDLTANEVTLRNTLGQVIFNVTIAEGNYYSTRIDLADLPAGVYYLTLIDNVNGATNVTKLIKQ